MLVCMKKPKDEKHLQELIDQEPDWSLLEHKEIVEQLFPIHNHFDIVNKLKPKSVEELAAVLAIIRPAKRNLLNMTWPEIMQTFGQKPKTIHITLRRVMLLDMHWLFVYR